MFVHFKHRRITGEALGGHGREELEDSEVVMCPSPSRAANVAIGVGVGIVGLLDYSQCGCIRHGHSWCYYAKATTIEFGNGAGRPGNQLISFKAH